MGDKWETSVNSHLSPTLVSHSGCLGPHDLHVSPTCFPHVSPTLDVLERMSLHLSPTCLQHLSSALVSHSGCLGPHEFTLVLCAPGHPEWETRVGNKWETRVNHAAQDTRMSLHLSPPCLPHLSPTLGALGRMSLHLSPPCLPHLSPTLGALGRMSLHLSMRPKAPRVGDKCGRQGGDKCKLMRPKAPRVGDKCGRQGGDKCKLPTCPPHLSPTLGVLGRMIFHLSPTLVSHTCLPLWVLWADFTLVSHLSPTLVSHSGCLGSHVQYN